MSKEKKRKIAIIGGTGLTSIKNFEIVRREIVMTPHGEPSSPISFGCFINENKNGTDIKFQQDGAEEVLFLARHGHAHNIPPHMVNYRANIWSLKKLGVDSIIAVNAVGGIREDMLPGSMVLPDQIIDYTSSRKNTFFESNLSHVTHIDFSYPYNHQLRKIIQKAAEKEQIKLISGATYAATEGPRLETAAEIQRLKRDNCDIVGMTGMPEAALARELKIDYASICVNANWAAGLSGDLITMEAIEENLLAGMANVRQLLAQILG